MLKKLIKHELAATRRFFLPAYGVFVLLLLLERLSLLAIPVLEESDGVLGIIAGTTMGLITTVTVIGLIILMIAPMIYGIIRFYRNMLGDEGYLTFTLPVTTGQLIDSKLLVTVIWETLTGIVVSVFGGIFLATLDPKTTAEVFEFIGNALSTAWDYVGIWVIVVAVVSLMAVFGQIFTQIMTFYTCMSIGQCAGKHKLLASAGCYIAINSIVSWLVQTPLMILAVSMEDLSLYDWIDRVLTDAINTGNYTVFCQFLVVILLIAIIVNLLFFACYYFVTRYFLTKKLNLA